MGTTESKKQQILIPHERFTKFNIDHSKNIIQSQIPVDFKKSDFQYWKVMINQIKSDPNSSFLFLPQSYDQKMPSLACNNSPKLKLTFPLFPFLLQQQIKNRVLGNQKNYFDEQQLWLLLYSLVKSQRAFSNLSLKVGDIHPHNIFVNHEGYPRLATQFTWPNQKTNFQKMYYQKTLRFIAPQQMNLCQMGQYPDLCSSSSSQAFSIGLSILSAGLLQNLQQICDMRSFKFNQRFLINSLNSWQNLKWIDVKTGQYITYSRQLKQIIKNLCKIKPQQRYLASKVYQLLKPFEQKILNVQKFDFNNTPKQPTIDEDKSKTDLINKNKDRNDLNYKQKNSYYKQLFSKYADSGRKENRKQQQNMKNLWQIKKDLQLQFTQSIHQQNNQIDSQKKPTNPQSSIPIYQYGNYSSIIDSGAPHYNYNIGSTNDNSFKGNYNSIITNPNQNNSIFYTGKVIKQQTSTINNYESSNYQPTSNILTNKRNIESFQIKQISNGQNQDFRIRGMQNDFLKKLQKQIEQSKRSFPGTQNQTNSTNKYHPSTFNGQGAQFYITD